ncbi:unnamed protein product [Camellia sinensis]
MVYQMLIHMVGVPAARQQQVRKAEEWLAARGKVEDDMQQPKDKRGSMAFKRGASSQPCQGSPVQSRNRG